MSEICATNRSQRRELTSPACRRTQRQRFPLLPPPTLGERRHRVLARRLIAGASVCVLAEVSVHSPTTFQLAAPRKCLVSLLTKRALDDRSHRMRMVDPFSCDPCNEVIGVDGPAAR